VIVIFKLYEKESRD